MSFAAYKMMHWPTGIENCGSGFITHSRSDSAPRISPIQTTDDLDSDWPPHRGDFGPIPNLVVTAANILELYLVRIQEDGSNRDTKPSQEPLRGGLMDGLAGASLELVSHYRLHANVETMAILSVGGGDGSKRRDSIILAFRDAKISVLEFDDSIHGLRTR
jgi:cleavage and polyadenylation specificity factor subunit 1